MSNTYIVYMHKTPSEKYYIGITKMIPIKRWGKNGYNYKRHIHFFNAILKYGWDNIEHIILNTNLSECEAKRLEIEYIIKYKSFDRRFGYNKTTGGDGTAGISRSGTKNGRATKVLCVNTGKIFDTIAQASEFYNVSRKHIGSVCSGKRGSCGKFNGIPLVWKYYKGVE